MAAEAASSTLFEDIFEVTKVNPEGKKFERGTSRQQATRATRAGRKAGRHTDRHSLQHGRGFVIWSQGAARTRKDNTRSHRRAAHAVAQRLLWGAGCEVRLQTPCRRRVQTTRKTATA